MTFSTYITTWNKNPYDMVMDMISKNVLAPDSRIILAFASFNFSSTDYIPGLNNMTIEQLKQLTTLVHNNNLTISLSIGGATYPFSGSDLYSRPGDLASNINVLVTECGFDGVDFDIEDSGASVPSDFVNNTSSLINTIRSLNSDPNFYITLTTAAQAWGTNMWQQQVINLTIGNINAWQPMEYDLWIAPDQDYYNQIMYDINYYTTTWGIIANKIILGLMPGKDDMGHNLSLNDALNLTNFAITQGLKGVMTWDANIDSMGIDNNAPYAYCMGIQSELNKVSDIKQCCNIN
jgi:chitinase